MNDDAGTGRWMTYDELAEVRGIKRIGAVRLVQRYKWRRQAGNDGRARVLVPHDALEKVRGTDAGIDTGDGDAGIDAGSAAGTGTTLLSGSLAALEDAVAVLREQLDAVNARAERAEADRADERRRADDLHAQIDVLNAELVVARADADRAAEERHRANRTEAALTGERDRAEAERSRADALRDRLTTMQEQLADAHAALQAAAGAETRVAAAEGRADRAEQAIVGERARPMRAGASGRDAGAACR